MKTAVLFGAGQIGAVIARLIGADWNAVCFADNCREKWGASLAGIPIVSPEESLTFDPGCFCLCVLDRERADAMERQLRNLGYAGPVLRPNELQMFDARAATMRLLAEQIRGLHIPGDAAELGVYRGDFAAMINAAFPDRTLRLFDTFEGFPARDVDSEASMGCSVARAGDFGGTSAELVRERLPFPRMAEFYAGYFPDTFLPCMGSTFAFVSVDADLYAPTAAALPLFWDRLSPGGVIMVHDACGTQFPGAGKAVGEFCAGRGLLPMPVCDLHGSVVLRKPL